MGHLNIRGLIPHPAGLGISLQYFLEDVPKLKFFLRLLTDSWLENEILGGYVGTVHLNIKFKTKLIAYPGCPRRSYKVLKGLYFRFSIYKAIRKVLFLRIFIQRSCKGLILNATEFFLQRKF